MTGLQLFGVVLLGREDGARKPDHPYHHTPTVPRPSFKLPETNIVQYRELGAIVRTVPYAAVDAIPEALDQHESVVEAAFQRGAVLPAPFGAVFRSHDQIQRWLEMNYIALAEGMHFVEGRCEMRVHMEENGELASLPDDERPDAAAAAAECFKLLRKQAIAAVPLRRSGDHQDLMGAAFLIPRVGWDDFTEVVLECGRRHDHLLLEQTGPWPPYDFVRLDLGS